MCGCRRGDARSPDRGNGRGLPAQLAVVLLEGAGRAVGADHGEPCDDPRALGGWPARVTARLTATELGRRDAGLDRVEPDCGVSVRVLDGVRPSRESQAV